MEWLLRSSKKRDRKKKSQPPPANSTTSAAENHTELVPHGGGGVGAGGAAITGAGAAEDGDLPATINISIKDIKMAMEVFNIQHKPAKTQEEAMQKAYQFWSTQPVPKMGAFHFFFTI